MTSEKIRVRAKIHEYINKESCSPDIIAELDLSERDLREAIHKGREEHGTCYWDRGEDSFIIKNILSLLQGKESEQEVKEQRSCEHIGTLMIGLNGEPYTKCIKCSRIIDNSADTQQPKQEEKEQPKSEITIAELAKRIEYLTDYVNTELKMAKTSDLFTGEGRLTTKGRIDVLEDRTEELYREVEDLKRRGR
jgi:hypothetical protein